MTRVGIIGLGFVGLPLAVEFVRAGAHVTGVDVDPRKAELIAAARTYIEDIPDADLAEINATGRFLAHVNGLEMDSVPLTAERIAAADCVVIATNHKAVDLGMVVAGAKLVVDLRNAVRTSLGGGPVGPVPGNVDVL